jgi:hypothetical protein
MPFTLTWGDIAVRLASSFSMLDLMRLPLGILSGMGFIGAGAILRKSQWGQKMGPSFRVPQMRSAP